MLRINACADCAPHVHLSSGGCKARRGSRKPRGLTAGSVHGSLSQYANCGGRGLCATCTVEVDPAPEPTHWHDAAAARFGYPRLSCCLTVEEPLRVELLDKYVWGQLLPSRLEHES